MPVDVHIGLLICLSSSSFCTSICLIHAYVYVNFEYALPSSSTFIYNYRHIHMYTCDDYCDLTTYNMKIPVTIRLCIPAGRGFARGFHTCDPMFKSLYFNIHTCLWFLWIHTYHVHIKKVELCMHLPLICQPSLYPCLFHPPKHVLMCECSHQDCSIQIKRMRVNKWMRNKIHIYAYIRIHILWT